MNDDDDIVQQRISGRSVHAISKAKGIRLADVNRALDLFAKATFNDKVPSTLWPSSSPDSMSCNGRSTRALSTATYSAARWSRS
jgi:hypothetical protein